MTLNSGACAGKPSGRELRGKRRGEHRGRKRFAVTRLLHGSTYTRRLKGTPSLVTAGVSSKLASPFSARVPRTRDTRSASWRSRLRSRQVGRVVSVEVAVQRRGGSEHALCSRRGRGARRCGMHRTAAALREGACCARMHFCVAKSRPRRLVSRPPGRDHHDSARRLQMHRHCLVGT